MALVNKPPQVPFGASQISLSTAFGALPASSTVSADHSNVRVATEFPETGQVAAAASVEPVFDNLEEWMGPEPFHLSLWDRFFQWTQDLFTPEWARGSGPDTTLYNHFAHHFTSTISKTKDSAEIPQYVIDYAPLVHLYSDEEFWPCDILEHLQHTTAYLNFTQIDSADKRRTLNDLDELNVHHRFAYLTSDDNVEDRPTWLGGKANIPDLPDKRSNNTGGRSDAPATLVVIEKEGGIVDAFWFFFYSYNLGNSVFNTRFGNHVGDW